MLKIIMAAFLLCLSNVAVSGVIVYDWSGTCVTDCNGIATGMLTFTDTFIPGEDVNHNPHTLSWEFNSDVFSYAMVTTTDELVLGYNSYIGMGDPGPLPSVEGTWGHDIRTFSCGGYSVDCGSSFMTYFHRFGSDDSTWVMWAGTNYSDLEIVASGIDSIWKKKASVPEPTALVLLALGLLGIGLTKYGSIFS